MPNCKNRLIVAAAGSGKTTFLVEEALKYPEDGILITTYTEANEAEIRKRFVEKLGYIPANVRIQTWFSFLIQHGVKPYQGGVLDVDTKGLLLVNTASTPYVKEANARKYYLSPCGRIFSDKLSKLVIRCNGAHSGEVVKRLSRLFARIYVDEVQDLAGYDLDLIKALFASGSAMVLVGDPRQVVYVTHYENRLKKYSDGKVCEFILGECRSLGVEIDDKSLSYSYRSNRLICQISDGLYPLMKATESKQLVQTSHDGVFLVAAKDVKGYLGQFKPIQLRNNRQTRVDGDHPVYNFGESKGLSFDRVLIYPTKEMLKWVGDRGTELAAGTRARFYVALTRARYSVAIVCDRLKALPAEIPRWP